MASTPNLHRITPLLPAGQSLEDELDFYRKELGFTLVWQSGSMAGIRRGEVTINLIENTNREWADNTSCSIGVDDLEELYEEYRKAQARVGPLEMKSWGRREFHMIVPSGVCFQFYQRPA
jgi:hypothetical protein